MIGIVIRSFGIATGTSAAKAAAGLAALLSSVYSLGYLHGAKSKRK